MTMTSPADAELASPPLLCRRVERRDTDDASVRGGPRGASEGEARTAGDDAIADTITLDETDRHRRRMAMISDAGIAFVLSLDTAVLLRDGDRLVLDDERRIVVRAAPEALHEVRGSDPHHLLRLAWHMGNRHLPTQLMVDHLRIRRDEVIAGMLRGLGADVREIEAGFDPEGGAYGETGGPPRRGGHGHPHHHHD